MPIEVESPEQIGYDSIRNNLSESSYTDARFGMIPGVPVAGSPSMPGGVAVPGGVPISGGVPVPGGAAVPSDLPLDQLLLCYGDHIGHEGLRQLIVEGMVLTKDNVLLTMGAAGALYIIATTLLEKDDELVVVRPNYSTNLETPRAIGAKLQYIDLVFEEKFELDIEKVKAAITPRTKYISVTHPHNPTGACLSDEQLRQLAALAEAHDCWLLVDETYRDMVFGAQLPLAATYSPKVISVSSLSKSYGLPGLRTGWVVTQDRPLLEAFLAAKEQIHICGPVLEEELAFRYFQKKDVYFPGIRDDIRRKFDIVKNWMAKQDVFEWVEPKGGAVCFPRLRRPDSVDLDQFYKILLEKYSTYVGPGHWFEMPRHYMRIGFGWPAPEALQEGLDALIKSSREACR